MSNFKLVKSKIFAATRKDDIETKRMLICTRLLVSADMSKLGYTGLIFVNPRVKVREAYHCNVLLLDKRCRLQAYQPAPYTRGLQENGNQWVPVSPMGFPWECEYDGNGSSIFTMTLPFTWCYFQVGLCGHWTRTVLTWIQMTIKVGG